MLSFRVADTPIVEVESSNDHEESAVDFVSRVRRFESSK